MQNELADQSVLYIYADGPKENATEDQIKKIEDVRQLIKTKKWCKEVLIIEAEKNKCLADSIVVGVTEVVNKHGKVIVLEDDIVTSKGFLKYMNDALDLYEKEESVFHISGYMYPHKEWLPETFFLNVPLCWGWATWQRAWQHFNPDPNELRGYFDKIAGWHRFNTFGGNILETQLRDNVNGKIRTWFIKWHGSVMVQNGYCLFPGHSLVNNIGFDNTGVHNTSTGNFHHEQLANGVCVKPVPVIESLPAEKAVKLFYQQLLKGPGQFTSGQQRNSAFAKLVPFKGGIRKAINKLIRWSYPELGVFKSKRLNTGLFSSVESNCILGPLAKIYQPFELYDTLVGDYTYSAPNAHITDTVIGRFCSIGPNFTCGRGLHPVVGISTAPMFYSTLRQNGTTLSMVDKVVEKKTIVIGNDVFIGANVTVIDGVTIGDGAVIGAGAVVSKDIPPYAIAVGCPIQIIKYRFSEEQIKKLLEIKWWDFPEDRLADVEKYFFDIDAFIRKYSNA